MSASVNPIECDATIHYARLHSKLSENEAMISALDRGQKTTQREVSQIREKQDAIAESVGTLAEEQGRTVTYLVSIDGKISKLTSSMQTLSDEVAKLRQSHEQHVEEVDLKFDSMPEDDVLLADTGLFEAMTGKEVKGVIAKERSEREKLQNVVVDMKRAQDIHEAEKVAVQQAKEEWERRQRSADAEQTKLKGARYGMYGAIGAAALTTAATITIALINLASGG